MSPVGRPLPLLALIAAVGLATLAGTARAQLPLEVQRALAMPPEGGTFDGLLVVEPAAGEAALVAVNALLLKRLRLPAQPADAEPVRDERLQPVG